MKNDYSYPMRNEISDYLDDLRDDLQEELWKYLELTGENERNVFVDPIWYKYQIPVEKQWEVEECIQIHIDYRGRGKLEKFIFETNSSNLIFFEETIKVIAETLESPKKWLSISDRMDTYKANLKLIKAGDLKLPEDLEDHVIDFQEDF